VDSTVEVKLPPPLDDDSDRVRFLFAGNCGRFQGLERLIAATKQISDRVPFQLVFMGEGSAKRELIRLAGDELNRRIFFVAQQPTEVALAAMRKCDYGIVSLLSAVYRFAYPSKSMSYWAAGCPVVALVEPESELATTIGQHRLGLVAASRSVSDIADVITKAVVLRHAFTAGERHRIERTCRALFGTKRMLAAWDDLLPGANTAVREPLSTPSVLRNRGAATNVKRRARPTTPCLPSMHK
jgi:glycosyltransferase involved in cell wall biosynthesis